MSKYIPT